MGICGSTKTDETVSCFEKLKTTAFSYRLNDDQLMEFAVYWTVLRIGKDEKVEGLPQGDFYIVMDGDIDLKLSDAVICHKTRGDCLGVPQEQKSQTGEELTAVARTPTVLLQLTADNWEIYAAENPTLKDKILPLMGQSTKRLAKVECFEGIPSARLTLLNMMFKYVVLRKGDTLFKEESLGSSLYVVLDGAVQAVARIRTNERKSVGSAAEADKERESVFDVSKSKMLHEFKANEIFGEISLIMDIPRTAAIVASEDALMLELTRHSFQSFLRTVPDRDLPLNRIIKVRIAQHFRKYKVPFFAAIPDEKYSILSSYCEIVQIAANTVIFKEGDVGHEFYMIAHGEVKVTVKKENKDGKLEDLELTRMGPGMYFGEIALVQETARTATLTTVKRSVLLSISKANFEKFFNEAPEAIADFEIKLARYNVQLRSVMYHPLGLEYFTRHVKAEFAEENIEFWKECRDYRHLTYADIATEDVSQFKSRNASIIFVDKKSLDGYGEGDDEAEETLLEKGKPEEPKEKETTKEQPRPSSSPRKTTSPEKRLADYNAAFNIYAKNDVMMLVDFKRLMELVGINTDLAEEEVEHLMAAAGFSFTPIATSEEAKHEKSVLESKVEKSKIEKSEKKEDSDPEHSVKLGGMQTMIEKHTTAKLFRDKFIKSMVEANRQSQPKTPSHGASPTPRRTFSSVVLWKMQKALVDNEIAKLQQVCELIDTEGVGKISFYNFQTVMKQLGYDMAREKLKSKFDQMDDKSTGEVSFEEFVKFMISDKRSKDSFKELLRRRATFIYNEYVSPSAPKQVNIQGPTRKKVKEDVEANIVSLATFDKAEQEILALLSTDTFARFKQSQLFQQFLDSAASYTHVKAGDEKKKGKDKPKHFRASSMDKSLDGGGKKEKAHDRHESISIDSLMKTLGTDDLFSIRVGGLGRGAGGEGGKEAEKPVAMSSLTEEDEESEAS